MSIHHNTMSLYIAIAVIHTNNCRLETGLTHSPLTIWPGSISWPGSTVFMGTGSYNYKMLKCASLVHSTKRVWDHYPQSHAAGLLGKALRGLCGLGVGCRCSVLPDETKSISDLWEMSVSRASLSSRITKAVLWGGLGFDERPGNRELCIPRRPLLPPQLLLLVTETYICRRDNQRKSSFMSSTWPSQKGGRESFPCLTTQC